MKPSEEELSEDFRCSVSVEEFETAPALEGYKYLHCEYCDAYFIRKRGKGRPPTMCDWAKVEIATAADLAKKEASDWNKKTTKTTVSVPIFEPATLDNVKVDSIVYTLSSDSVVARIHAKSYLVEKITPDGKFVITRHAKVGYERYKYVVNPSRVVIKTGHEHIDVLVSDLDNDPEDPQQ